MNTLLIAGTDSGVGKTVLATALAAYWQRHLPTQRLGMMKPLQCGTGDLRFAKSGDSELYTRLFSLNQPPEQTNPISFQAPLVPPIAAEREGQLVKLEEIWQQFETLTQQRDFVIVESLGGLGTPITHETTVADLAWDWRIATVLVVPVQPGAIAHAVANTALARQAHVHLKGIVLNCVQPCSSTELADWAPVDLIQSLTQKPVLGCIPHLADPTDLAKLAQVASNLDLERLLPLIYSLISS